MSQSSRTPPTIDHSLRSFDPVWEALRREGRHLNRYPYEFVVSFVLRNAPAGRAAAEVRILEVGCGGGNNLWFAAREGFHVTGIDASPSAIAYARARFAGEGLRGNFCVGDFTGLPFPDAAFHLAIDRQALSCCGRSLARRAVHEVRRVLVPGGRFLMNVYSVRHPSASSGTAAGDGLRLDISAGNLANVGQICFYDREDIDAVLDGGWHVLSCEHVETTDDADKTRVVHAEWRCIIEKPK